MAKSMVKSKARRKARNQSRSKAKSMVKSKVVDYREKPNKIDMRIDLSKVHEKFNKF